MSEGMKRRDVLVRLGLAAAGVGGAWWLRDNVLWRRPEVTFPTGANWLNYDEPRADVPTVRAVVAGRPVRALIDSGAQYSVIDRVLFESLGLTNTFDMPLVAYGVSGDPQLGRGTRLDVVVGGLRIGGLRTAILALGPIAVRAGLGASLILGRDLLGEGVLDIDVDQERLRFLAPGTAMPAIVSPVAVRKKGGALVTEATVEGATVEAVVDTGASALIALSRSTAEGAGLLDGRHARRGASIVLGGAMASSVVEARTVTFGDQLYERVETPIYPDVALPGFPAALLGMAAFAGRRMVMDLGAGRLAVSRPLDLTILPRA